MVLLPGGSYVPMKPDPEDETHERQIPGAMVTVAPFWLDVTPVTAEDYARCVVDGACSDEGLRCTDPTGWGEHSLPTYGNIAKGDHPVNCVSQLQATAYCDHVGKRLPTANEWSWAAHGADRGTPLPWGDEVPQLYYDKTYLCWGRSYFGDVESFIWACHFLFFGCSAAIDYTRRPDEGTCPVRAHPMGDSPQGIADLVGNVLEWTSTMVPGEKEGRAEPIALEGGACWRTFDPRGLNVDASSNDFVSRRYDTVGFRCAWTDSSGGQ